MAMRNDTIKEQEKWKIKYEKSETSSLQLQCELE